jgi:succinate dehydrogenase / fumarate reductase, cytochrome b subunit
MITSKSQISFLHDFSPNYREIQQTLLLKTSASLPIPHRACEIAYSFVMNAITRCLCNYWSSSIGKKLIVALTGLVLAGFLAGHLSGNLLMYVGRAAFNEYAEFLHHMLHGAGVWIARVVLLTMLVIHVVATISLTRQNRAARQPYEYKATIQASKSSRIMIWSGLTILAFVIFHLLHFTVRVDSQLAGIGATDPYGMVIVGFRNPLVVLFYIIAMTLLCSHLSHGVASIFQTLGLRSKKAEGTIKTISVGYSLAIWAGFISIPISVLTGLIQ